MIRTIVFFIFLVFAVTATGLSQPASKNKDSVYLFKKGSPDGIGKWFMGREIAHVMGASGSDWLERTEREEEENPALAIDSIHVRPDAVIADIGAGTGYYSFRLAKKVPQGRVYAVEIQEELLQFLKNKKRERGDTVVSVIKSTSASPNLPDNSVDLALMVDVYHELEFPAEMLQSLRRALRKGGKILLIEYRGEDPSIPIKTIHKTTVAQMGKELGANGFQLVYRGEFLPIQHFLLFQKQ